MRAPPTQDTTTRTPPALGGRVTKAEFRKEQVMPDHCPTPICPSTPIRTPSVSPLVASRCYPGKKPTEKTDGAVAAAMAQAEPFTETTTPVT